jgi:hypothetical protein
MPVTNNPSFPSNRLNRANYFQSLGNTTNLPWGKVPTTCMCYTYSKNYIYKPHSAAGMVGTTAASFLSRRKRI